MLLTPEWVLKLARVSWSRRPRGVEAQFEGSALVGPAVVVVGGGDVGRDGDQVPRPGDGAQPLRRPDVGRANHADPAGGPRLRGGPLHGVVPVVDVVNEAIELPAGGEAPAGVLDNQGEPGLGSLHGVEHLRCQRPRLVVRRALQDGGKRAGPVGPVHVGIERGAVAHSGGNIGFHLERNRIWHGSPS